MIPRIQSMKKKTRPSRLHSDSTGCWTNGLQWLVTTVTTVTSNKSDIWLLTFVLTRLFDLVKLRDWIESFHAMLELRDKDRQPSSPESSAMATPPTRPPLVPSQETCFFPSGRLSESGVRTWCGSWNKYSFWISWTRATFIFSILLQFQSRFDFWIKVIGSFDDVVFVTNFSKHCLRVRSILVITLQACLPDILIIRAFWPQTQRLDSTLHANNINAASMQAE